MVRTVLVVAFSKLSCVLRVPWCLWWLPVAVLGVLAAGLGLFAPQLLTTEALDTDVYIRSGRNVLTRPEHLYTESYPIRPFTYPPFAAVLFTSFLAIPDGARTAALGAVSVVCLFFVLYACLVQVQAGVVWAGGTSPCVARGRAGVASGVGARWCGVPLWAAVLTLLVLGLEPVFRNLAAGQMNLVLLPLTFFAVTVAPVGVAGALVGLAAGVKITPALFGAWFLLRRRWRDVWVCVGTFGATVLVGALVAPGASWAYWTGVLFDDQRVGAPAFVYNQALKGALLRWWGPDLPSWVWLVAVVVTLCVGAVALWRAASDALAGFAVLALTGVLVSPISWSHHWVVMVPVAAAMVAVVWGLPRGSMGAWCGVGLLALWLVVLASHVMWVGGSGNDLEYSQPFVVKVAQSSHTILGALSLVWFALCLRRGAGCHQPECAGTERGE